ncbi:MAG: hypothetical protein ACO3ND_07230, partial [Opitutales bacterium]
MNPTRHCITAALALAAAALGAAEPVKVLIIDGRNNHDWQGTTASLKATLAAVGGFQVDVSTAPPAFTKRAPQRPKKMDAKQKADFENMKKTFEQGQQLRADKDYAGAITAYRTASQLDPEQEAVWANLA